jgi:hypothetical protein
VGHWTWASATTKGTSHIRTGTRRQDAFRCYVPADSPEFLICVVSDGAGSADYGGQGASLVCRTISLAAQKHLRTWRDLPTDEEVGAWVDRVRDRISYAARQRGKTPRDFAATMISVLSDGRRTLIAQVGDGCAALKAAGTAEWRIPLWPDHGEYASTTTFVTDDPEAKCRIVREDAEIFAFAALTDGLERLALDFSCERPSGGFFDGMAKPVSASSALGKDAPLSSMLKQYLEGEAVCSRTDDDKTLVIAARR